ncbi:MAG: hypothetical protein U5R46_09700 [Gammaproteobacteria bacterium]|nr:hypothetical protein [Gammaproteobacteria bacterium]
MKTLFIMGLGHSGSTILELSLSRFPDTVGLGEIKKILKRPAILSGKHGASSPPVCACGETVTECTFWSTIPDLQHYPELRNRYGRFFEALARNGVYNAAVDSSKSLEAFNVLHHLHNKEALDLRVIFLLRDVRGWAQSARDRDRRHGNRARPLVYHYLQWYRHNRRMQRVLADSGTPYIQRSYEEFCFDPGQVLGDIRTFAELPAIGPPGNGRSNAHNLNGNRTRRDPLQNIRYDARWLSGGSGAMYSILLPHVLRWNNAQVYRNAE